MLIEVEKDTSVGVTINPSIRAEAIYNMNVPPTTANPTSQVPITSLVETTIVFYS